MALRMQAQDREPVGIPLEGKMGDNIMSRHITPRNSMFPFGAAFQIQPISCESD